jgi:phospholipid/cholesterol/gamma-HCH transport system permease protein
MGFILRKFRFLDSIGAYLMLIFDVFGAAIRRPPRWGLIATQLYSIGVLSLPVVAMTGFSTGLVLAAQAYYQLADKGLASATGIMVAKAMVTELGPVLTAFMVTGRVGAAMCAEIGTMQVTEQVDALQTMAVNPNRYLIAPRFIAGSFMLPLLTIFSIVMGIFGGYLIAVYYFGMSPSSFLDPIPEYITFFDLFMGIVKAFIFGVFIVTICCYKGLRTSGGAEGVGRSTTNSVVISYTVILFGNFLLTLGLSKIQLQIERWFS